MALFHCLKSTTSESSLKHRFLTSYHHLPLLEVSVKAAFE
jgi:hypothetical protein